MDKQLLLNMLTVACTNKPSKHLSELLLQIAVDPELDDEVTLDCFSNEFYSVRSISMIRQCFNFSLR